MEGRIPGRGISIRKGLEAGGQHHVFEEAAGDVCVQIIQVKVKYEGELLPKGERPISDGLLRRVKEQSLS